MWSLFAGATGELDVDGRSGHGRAPGEPRDSLKVRFASRVRINTHCNRHETRIGQRFFRGEPRGEPIETSDTRSRSPRWAKLGEHSRVDARSNGVARAQHAAAPGEHAPGSSKRLGRGAHRIESSDGRHGVRSFYPELIRAVAKPRV